MIPGLLERLERPVTFVVGKGGVGKTTTAGGIALALADRGDTVRLLSTDPAHSLGDLFGGGEPIVPCNPRLVLEELDAGAFARRRLDAIEPGLRQIVERGTYLDDDDAASLLGGSLPGLDEIGAALRIREIALEGGRLVVDTAPTGHTLRMLDAPSVLAGWVRVFRAMADKADTVASALVGQAIHMSGERALEELAADARAFSDIAGDADFVVVSGVGAVVEAETRRLLEALEERGLHVAATAAIQRPGAAADVLLPMHPGLEGCEALRAWIGDGRAANAAEPVATAEKAAAEGAGSGSDPGRLPPGDSSAIVTLLDRELVIFAGKGGVGKTTSAAAAAVLLARSAPVLLAGADPAGSLHDVLPDPPEGLEVRELDADAEMANFRERYREEVEGAFRAVGLDGAARMDRDVVESLLGLAPPGVDEIVAVARLAEAAEPGRRIVLDTAPTGHFLRLLAMPEVAGDWIRRLMRVLIKYRAMGGLDVPAEPLLRFARRLRALQERLADPSRTAIVIVTLDEPLVRAETRRLVGTLGERGQPAVRVLVNRASASTGEADLRAPEVAEPVGADRLLALAEAWEILR